MISMDTRMKIIAHIHTDFPDKFGIPRQSGLVEGLTGEIIFEPEYRNPEIIRGIEQFSHIWLLWKFSESKKEHWSATVKPPRLGGKVRLGVFATRSPFRRASASCGTDGERTEALCGGSRSDGWNTHL